MESSVIFLSSVVTDLKQERDAISEVLQRIQQIVSRCEYFPARSESPEQVCLNEAKSCDLFIGVYKKRYGFIPSKKNPKKVSVTEMEYNSAKEAKKPILIFYHSKTLDRDPELDLFLDKVKHFSKGHYVQKFSSINELKYLILHSIVFNLKNSQLLNDTENILIEKLIPDLIKYKKFLFNKLEYNSTSGISRPSSLIQYSLEDLFIPPKISKYPPKENSENTQEAISRTFSFNTISQNTGWDSMVKIVKEMDNPKNKITTGIDIFEKTKIEKPTVILGEPGSGKSTLMNMFSIGLIKKTEILPINIPVRDLINRIKNSNKESVLDYLKERHKDLGINNSFFLNRLNGGSCVIIFDGLDEVWEVKDRKIINDIIQNFSSMWSEYNKIFITSRIRGYFQNPLQGNIEVLHLDEFSSEKITEFVYKWAYLLEKQKIEKPDIGIVNENSENLTKLIFDDYNILKLAKNPLVLYILCLAFMKNMTFPKRKHWLYNILIETLLSTRESRKGIVLTNLDFTDFSKILRKISFWMFDNNQSQIQENDLIRLIKEKLTEEGISTREQFNIKDILTRLEDRSGILFNDGVGNYSFTHLSFLEYFVALELTETKNHVDIFKYLEPKLHSQKNLDVISFTCSILSDKSRKTASEFLEAIIKSGTLHEELHLLDLTLVLHCMSDGALISDDLSDDLFKLIDIRWDAKRNYDIHFMIALEQLISTPYEQKIVEFWQRKNRKIPSSAKFNPLSLSILTKSDYVHELFTFCKNSLKSETDRVISLLLLNQIIVSRPRKQLIEFIVNNLDKLYFPILTDSIILEMAKFCTRDDSLKNLYFYAIFDVENKKIQKILLQYSYLIDKKKAKQYLMKLPKNKDNADFQQILLGQNRGQKKNKLSPSQNRLKMLNDMIKDKKQDKSADLISSEIEDMKELDEDFLKALVNSLEVLPLNRWLLVIAISETLSKIIDKFPDAKIMLLDIFDSKQKLVKKWMFYLQSINLKILSEKDATKKNLLKIIKDDRQKKVLRQKYLKLYLENFPSDDNIDELLSKLLNEDIFTSHVLNFIKNNPRQLKQNISKVISLSQTVKGPLYGKSINVIRQFIINS